METYFYHSFPRRGRVHQDTRERGLRILELILRHGLLLVPEEVTWSDPTAPQGSKITSIQRRVCFTELPRDELPQHAQMFGPFALEFSIRALRNIGGMPVMYIPEKLDPDEAYGSIATSALAHLASARSVVRYLAETQALTAPTIHLTLTKKSGEVATRNFDERETAGIRDYLSLLQGAEGLPFHDISNALSALASIFYPTENLTYNGELAYYRQREWRVFSGGFWDGKPTTSVVTEQHAEALLALDKPFFSKELDFADGRFTLAAKSHALAEVQGRPILSFVRRIVVPKDALDQAIELVHRLGIEIAIESLA